MKIVKGPLRPARTFEELPDVLVLPEVADVCSMAYMTILNYVYRGELKARKARGVWLVNKSAVRAFAKNREITMCFNRVERAL